MATIMSRTDFARGLEDGLNTYFGLEDRLRKDEWKPIYEMNTTQKAWEEDKLLVGLGVAQKKTEGDAAKLDAGGEAWSSRFDIMTVATRIEITEEAIDDNRYMQLGPAYAKECARALINAKEIFGAATLNNAFSSSFPGGDGVPLISAVHPLAMGGTFSNTLATASDLDETALEDLLIQIRTVTNDRAIPMALSAELLIVPPQEEYNAFRLTESPYRPGTNDNDVNAIYSKGIFAKPPHVMTRLTDPDAWFILTDCPNGMKYFEHTKGNKRRVNIDHKTGNYQYLVSERYQFGYTNPRAIFASAGA